MILSTGKLLQVAGKQTNTGLGIPESDEEFKKRMDILASYWACYAKSKIGSQKTTILWVFQNVLIILLSD